MNPRFANIIAPWTKELVQGFCNYRQHLLTDGPGNLCTPTAPHVCKSAPFDEFEYQYAHLIGDLMREPWSTLLRTPPQQLIDGDLRAKSKVRRGGFKCWDTAIAAPACANRYDHLILMQETPAIRNCNAYWRSTAVPALERVGRLTSTGEFLRPKGPWIVDLTRWTLGWKILESAHALAHQRADHKRSMAKGPGATRAKAAGNFQRYVSEQVFAWAYGIPFDVSEREDGNPGEPDFKHYGIELKSSSTYGNPMLRIPWDGREALRVDETLIVASAGVFIEPHPYGFEKGTRDWSQRDRWCCKPSAVILPGWAGVDFITHQMLGVNNFKQKDTPICYMVNPLDLLAPDLLGAYLKQTHDEIGEPSLLDDNGKQVRWYVEDWLESDELRKLLAETKPLPCRDCLMINHKTRGAPMRPAGWEPRERLDEGKAQHLEWIEYNEQLDAIHATIKRGTIFYEYTSRGVTRDSCVRERKARTTAHNKKIGAAAKAKSLAKVLAKREAGNALTARDIEVYRTYLEAENEREAETNDEGTSQCGS